MQNKDKYLPWIGAGLAALVLATIGRYVALRSDADTGTANLVFIIVLVSIGLLYFLAMELLEPLFKTILKRIRVKPKYRTSLPDDAVLRSKVESFCRYSDEILAGYVPEEQMPLLHRYIEQYAKGETGNIAQKITTTGLDNFELYHYGWNIWNHFQNMKQNKTEVWMKNVFSDLSGIKSKISSKFKHGLRATYKIPIEPNIK